MGNIQPYGRLKGRNHVGIYLFETISEQVFSASTDSIKTLRSGNRCSATPSITARRTVALSRP